MVAIEIRDPREEALPSVGTLRLVDPETGRQLRVDTSSQRLRERYSEAAAAERLDLARTFGALGVGHVVLSTSGDWLRTLAAFLRAEVAETMSFGSPLYLLALLVVPAVISLYVVHYRRRSRVAARFASPPLLPNVVDREPGRRRHVPPAILLIALTALLVGLARPKAEISVPREDATIMIAIDTSRSMAADDVRPSRMEAAKAGIREFLAEAPDSYRVGVVSFASDARLVAPPTRDRELVDLALDELRTGEGTALGDAIAKAVEVGQAVDAASAATGEEPAPTTVLLVSDGKEDGSLVSAQEASGQARERDVPVFTVGMGTPDGVVEVPLAGGYTARVEVPADPTTLRGVADATGGRFFSSPTLEQLRAVYGELESRLGREDEWREVTVAFAAAGAIMLLLGGALSASWFRRLP